MADSWELSNGLDTSVNDASLDPGEDGYSNIREFLADTDPGLGSSYPQLASVVEDFESGNLTKLPWTTSANGSWAVNDARPANGTYAAGSQPITHNESADFSTTIYVDKGQLGFSFSVSSESGWDYLGFFMDGVLVGGASDRLNKIDEWTGEVAYTTVSYPVAEPGMHTFTWKYWKDEIDEGAIGEDRAWLDDVTVPGAVDSDKDGSYGLDNGLRPLGNDAALDADNDGLSNIEEYHLNTDPQDATTPTNRFDHDGDADVDGLDAAELLKNVIGPEDLLDFADKFGK